MDLPFPTRQRYERLGMDQASYEAGDPIPVTRKPPSIARDVKFKLRDTRRKGGLRKDTDGGGGRA